jgi:hypothetical protein
MGMSVLKKKKAQLNSMYLGMAQHGNKACILAQKKSESSKYLWPGGVSLYHVSICCKLITNQVFLMVSREMEIMWQTSGNAGRVVLKTPKH